MFPWIVIGDFNAMLATTERNGGTPVCMSYCNEFRDSVEQAKLMDLRGKGKLFTWQRRIVFERLDRALCNSRLEKKLE